jgi:hypothetical protein
MNLTITIDKNSVQKSLETFFIGLVHRTYSWLSTDGEVLGYIIGVYHVLCATSIPILAIISHTIYPSVWLKLYVFINLLCVFSQHIFLNICILIPLEEKLTKQKTIFYPVIKTFLDPLNITLQQFLTYLVIAEGFTTLCFGLELLSNVSSFVFNHYGIDI